MFLKFLQSGLEAIIYVIEKNDNIKSLKLESEIYGNIYFALHVENGISWYYICAPFIKKRLRVLLVFPPDNQCIGSRMKDNINNSNLL